jgi:hypothetical protein
MLSLSAGGSGREFVRKHMGVSKNMGIKEYGSPQTSSPKWIQMGKPVV